MLGRFKIRTTLPIAHYYYHHWNLLKYCIPAILLLPYKSTISFVTHELESFTINCIQTAKIRSLGSVSFTVVLNSTAYLIVLEFIILHFLIQGLLALFALIFLFSVMIYAYVYTGRFFISVLFTEHVNKNTLL